MPTTLEYTYETKQPHLTEREAIERYKRALVKGRDALVVLDDLDCGHWTVSVFRTPQEKEQYYRDKISSLYRIFSRPFRKIAREHEIG